MRHVTVYHGSPEAVDSFRNIPTAFTPSFSKAVWYARRLETLRPIVYKCRLFVTDFDLRLPSAQHYYEQMRQCLPHFRLPRIDSDGFLQESGLPAKTHLLTIMSAFSAMNATYTSAWIDDGDCTLIVFSPVENCVLLTEDFLK